MMRVKSITHTLRACFSNQPKNIPKSVPLEFNFNIPKKSQSQKIASSSQVKITRAKRTNDINKILKKKKEGEQYKSKIQQSYQEEQVKKIQENFKTAKYFEQQYFKGEHLLENIPLDPYYSYKLADFERKVQMRNQKFKDFISNYTDFDTLADTKFKIAQLYHEKQQKYEVQEFLRYLDQYPGSPKGPKPEDDIQFFIQYAYKKIPAVLATELAAKSAKNKAKQNQSVKDMTEMQVYKIPAEGNYSSVMYLNRSLEQPLQKDWKRDQLLQGTSQFPIFKEYDEVPEMPQLPFNNYQHYMREYMNWKNFKNYYVAKHGEDILNKQIEYLYKVQSENDVDPENQYYSPRGNAPSLMRYYQTLPKQIQDHPGLKDIYLGLEYRCPFIPMQEKEQLLNLTCSMVLPLDKVSRRAMADFIEKKKEYVTPFMIDKIFTINPEYTWDIKDFFAEIKRQQLKGQSMIKEGETSYPEPPQIHLEWEEGTANLPVDYYQNDDGFWDTIISEKLKRQDQAKPIIKVRKHFYH